MCVCIVAGEKETDRKKKKKKKEKKKKKKKKDTSDSCSPDREAMKPTSSNSGVTKHNTGDASPLVRVKSEFPLEDTGKSHRDHAEKHWASRKNDARVNEIDRREVNSADNYLHRHRRSPGPPRYGTNIDSGRFPSVERSRLSDYDEKNVRREPNGEDRSASVKSAVRSQDCRLNSKPSTKNWDEEVSEQYDRRESRGKKRMRSTSPREDADHQWSRVVELNRNHRHQSSPDHRDGRQKTRRRNSSSDDDRNRMRSDRRSGIVEHERQHYRS